MPLVVSRRFVPVEVLAILVIAAVYAWHDCMLPAVVPLFLVATVSRYARGKSWDDAVRGSPYMGPAALAGLVALGLALLAGTPLVELTGRDVEWSQYPIVRGSAHQLFAVAVLVAVGAVAGELALRAWIVERALELGAARWGAVAIGALAEGVLWPGDLAARLGAAVMGAGLGVLYVAAGRRAGAPIAARVLFALGALALEGLKVVS